MLKFHPWTADKLHYLDRYAALVTRGMKNKWAETAYIDMFAGPGLGALESRPSEVMDGSPLVAAKQPKPFTHYVFVDSDDSHIRALEHRTRTLAPSSKKLVIPGNCNDPAVISEIRRFVPSGALTLAFIDPFTWDVAFDTVRALTESRNVDIILICMVGSMKRAAPYTPASLDRFFGDGGEWRSLYMSAGRRERTRVLRGVSVRGHSDEYQERPAILPGLRLQESARSRLLEEDDSANSRRHEAHGRVLKQVL